MGNLRRLFKATSWPYISRLRPLVRRLSSAKRASSRVRKLQHDFPGMRCFRLEETILPISGDAYGGNRGSLTYAFPAMRAAKNIGPPFQLLGLRDSTIFPRRICSRSQLRLKLAHDFLESCENSREVGGGHIGTKRAFRSGPQSALGLRFPSDSFAERFLGMS